MEEEKTGERDIIHTLVNKVILDLKANVSLFYNTCTSIRIS